MKNLLFPVIICVVLGGLITGCKKNSSSSLAATKPAVMLSKTTVARGEPLIASVSDLSTSAIIRWKIFPTPGTMLSPSRDQATVFFGNRGSYQLTAVVYSDSTNPVATDSSTSPVTVSDSVYTPPPPVQSDTSALAGDAIQIEPVTCTDTGGLILAVQTVNLYSCYPQLNYYFSQVGNTIELYCLSVSSMIQSCGGAMNTAKAVVLGQAPANGVYNFNVILNTATYRGTLTVTDQTYTFSWPYTSGVTLSPLQIATK
jgi:hypothetical protein